MLMGMLVGYIAWGRRAQLALAVEEFFIEYQAHPHVLAVSDTIKNKRYAMLVTMKKGSDTAWLPKRYRGFLVFTEESEKIVAY